MPLFYGFVHILKYIEFARALVLHMRLSSSEAKSSIFFGIELVREAGDPFLDTLDDEKLISSAAAFDSVKFDRFNHVCKICVF